MTITGQVFDDRDGDGVRGTNEPGVAGVPVTVDGAVAGVTGPGGGFSVVVVAHRGKALLSIVPPEGWRWDSSPFVVEREEESDIALPLQRLDLGADSATTESAAVAAVAGAGSVVLVVASLGALVFVGFASLMQAAATRSLERAYRQHESLELEHLQAQHVTQRRAELEDLLNGQPNAWREVLRQVLADALPAAAISASADEWITMTDVSSSPPSFTVAGQDEKSSDTYTFTVSPDSVCRGKLTKRNFFILMARNLFETVILMTRNRVIPLDASLAPTARVEVQAVWQHLMNQRGLDQRALPRQAVWYLVVTRRRK